MLVTGGTGSFGHQILAKLLTLNPSEVRIFSRDEKKQYDLSLEYPQEPRLRLMLGDVRDAQRLREAMRGVDVVYHAAALKQVPNCESNPSEAIKTNVQGALNVREAALAEDVEVLVAVSTDKAVKPVNVMGMTKALQERVILAPPLSRTRTRFLAVRYGNVVGSRGSVIPFFKDRIERGLHLPITDPQMTRFLLTLPEAIDLVFKASVEGKSGHLFVKKMPAALVTDVAHVMGQALGKRADYPQKIVGIRPGEKIHEVLVSEEEMRRAVESPLHYEILPSEESTGESASDIEEYASYNTRRLDEKGIHALLAAEGWV